MAAPLLASGNCTTFGIAACCLHRELRILTSGMSIMRATQGTYCPEQSASRSATIKPGLRYLPLQAHSR